MAATAPPTSPRFMLTTMASVAELEAGLISERTKAALKAAKARGVKLGRHGAEVLAPRFKAEARQRAMELEPVIIELKGKGLSLAKIAVELNKRKVPTPHLLSTLVAWTRSLVSTYLFGLTKDSTGISKVASFDVSGCCAQWKSVTKPRTFFLRLSPHLPKSSTPVAGPAATAQ